MSNVDGAGSAGVVVVGSGGWAGVAAPVGATEARAEAVAYGVAAPDMFTGCNQLDPSACLAWCCVREGGMTLLRRLSSNG